MRTRWVDYKDKEYDAWVEDWKDWESTSLNERSKIADRAWLVSLNYTSALSLTRLHFTQIQACMDIVFGWQATGVRPNIRDRSTNVGTERAQTRTHSQSLCIQNLQHVSDSDDCYRLLIPLTFPIPGQSPSTHHGHLLRKPGNEWKREVLVDRN